MKSIPAYLRATVEFLSRRSRAYQLVFGSEFARNTVLYDLAKFCRANETTFHPNRDVQLMLEGRREVWLRIQQHLNLTPEQLLGIYHTGKPDPNMKDSEQ